MDAIAEAAQRGPRAVVTTAPSGDPAEARELAERFGLAAQDRAGRILPELLRDAVGAPVLVLGKTRADLYQGAHSFRATPGMAFLRVLRARRGETDPLVRAAGLRPGDSVLDCTLGLGGDALVAAQAVGPVGRVVGLEASGLLAAFTLAGLRRLRGPIAEAAARIEVLHEDHRPALQRLASSAPGSVDVVLFDPMFRAPLDAGPLFPLLRAHAEHAPLEAGEVALARSVARRLVLVKDAWPGRELARLGLEPLPARRSAKIVFGSAGGDGA